MGELTEAMLAARFEYLDDLRDSGATNMFGAGAYIEAEFGDDEKLARVVLVAWMDSFDKVSLPADRAAKAHPKLGAVS